MAAEVEGGPLGGEDRAAAARDLGDGVARGRPPTPSGRCQPPTGRGRPGRTPPRHSAGRPRPRCPGPPRAKRRRGPGGHQRGGQVARAASTSSARARATAWRTARPAGGRLDVGAGPASPSAGPRTGRRGPAGSARPGRSRGSPSGEWAPRLSSRAGPSRGGRRPPSPGSASSPGAAGARPARRRSAATSATSAAATVERGGRADDPGARRSWPAGARRAAWPRRLARPGRVPARPMRPATPPPGDAADPRCRPGPAEQRPAWPRSARARRAPGDGLDQPGPEDHPLEQRVRGQPVGPVHPAAGGLAGRPQARAARWRPTGRSRPRPRGGGRPGRWAASRRSGPGRWPPARRRWSGTARRTARGRWRPATGGRRPARPSGRPWPGSPRRGGPARRRTARPRRRAGGRRGPAGPRRAAAGAWPGGAGAVGWNWTNSTSATATPARSAMATPSPVASVGLVVTAKSCPAPPVASTTWSGPHLDRPAPPGGEGQHPAAPPALDQQVDGEPALEHRAGRRPGGLHQRPLHLGPGGRAAGVDHPGPRVAALPGQRQRPRGLPVELGAHGDQLVHPGRALVDQHPDGVGVAEPGPRGQGVGQVQVGRVLVAPEHAATPPWAQRVADWESSPLVSTPTSAAAGRPRGGQPDGGREPGHPAARAPGRRRARARRRRPGRRRPAGGVTRGRGRGSTASGRRLVDRPVRPVDVDHPGPVVLELVSRVVGVGDEDHPVARATPAGPPRR